MAQVLNCGLSRETLGVLVAMIEKGANPEALVQIVKEMRNMNFNGDGNVIAQGMMTNVSSGFAVPK
jgi:hypothetical protein